MAKLTSAQIRKIIKAHNIEATVKIPSGLKKAELEKFVESKGFKINHDEKSISKGGKKITLEQAEKDTAPKQKTALQKQKTAEKKEEKVVAQKKKEREIKKEAVKKATKNLVPKTSVPKKVGSKPIPKKAEVKKEEPKKGKKKGEKVKFTEQAKEVQKKIVERKKKKELEARKPKRKQLGETKKPSGSAVVQPGKPEDLQLKKKGVIKNKKPKPQPESNITQLKGFKVLEKVYEKGYAKRIKLRKKYLEGGFKKEMDWEMEDEDEDDEMRGEWMTLSIPQDDVKFLFVKSPYNDKGTVLQKVDDMLEKRVKNYKTWLNLMKKEPEDLQLKKKGVIKNKKPKPPSKEKAFDFVLEQVLSVYYDNLIPKNVSDREEKKYKKEANLIEKIYESKKTSNFTKQEISILKRVLSVAKANDIRNRELKQFEDIVENLGTDKAPKAEPKKAEPKKGKSAVILKLEKERAEREQKQKRELLKQYKDRWEKNFKKQYQWTDAQVKRIEEILFNKNGIKSTGADNVQDGFKLFFSVDGKTDSSATFKFPKFTKGKKDQSMMKGKN